MGGKPVDDSTSVRQCLLDEGQVVHVHPVVVNHAYPKQRERWNELRQRRRIAALRKALGNARVVDVGNGLPREAAVASHGIGDECLNARVADVLHLLPVRGIHVGLVRAEAGGAPSGLPQCTEVGDVTVDGGASVEGVSRKPRGQRVEPERRIFRGDVELQIAPGAPPKGLEAARVSAAGDEIVSDAVDVAAFDFVAIAFLSFRVVESLRVGELDFSILAGGDSQLGISRLKLASIEQQSNVRVRGDLERRCGEATVDGSPSVRTVVPAAISRCSIGGSWS